jgi:hypothetical protein
MRSRLLLVEESRSAEEERIGAILPPFAMPWRPSWKMSSRTTCGL